MLAVTHLLQSINAAVRSVITDVIGSKLADMRKTLDAHTKCNSIMEVNFAR